MAGCAALALLAVAACSSSSTPIPKGNLEIEGGPADSSADVTELDSGPVDGSTDATQTDDSPGPGDAPTVDAAFACAHPSSFSDCGYCANKPECLACAIPLIPSGQTQLAALLRCSVCTGCYTACKGSLAGCSAPMMPNNCDTSVASNDNCAQCLGCAVNPPPVDATADGECLTFQQQCLMNPECQLLLGKLNGACQVP